MVCKASKMCSVGKASRLKSLHNTRYAVGVHIYLYKQVRERHIHVFALIIAGNALEMICTVRRVIR